MSSQWQERFWEKVQTGDSNHCWEWLGSKDDCGYGMININGKTFRTHRISWIMKNGEIPGGLLVLHKCDNPPCCNPNHLFLGTHADNSKDKIKKGRHIFGERSSNAKLTEHDVEEIRVLYKTGNYSHRKLGNLYNVSHTVIESVLNNKAWKEVIA